MLQDFLVALTYISIYNDFCKSNLFINCQYFDWYALVNSYSNWFTGQRSEHCIVLDYNRIYFKIVC